MALRQCNMFGFHVEKFSGVAPVLQITGKLVDKNFLKVTSLKLFHAEGRMATKFKNKSDIVKLTAPNYTGEHWSSATEGFGIRVGTLKKNGNYERIYLARWRDEHGKDQKFKIGYVDEMNFSDAEDAAREKVKLEKRKVADVKAGVERAPTLKQGYEKYIAARRAGWKVGTLEDYDKRFVYLAPYHDRVVDELSRDDWFDLYADISVKSGPAMAAAAHGLARTIYSYLQYKELVLRNPCLKLVETARERGMLIQPPAPRERHIPLEQIPDYWRVLHSRIQPDQRDYILWMLFTGFRQALVGKLAWERVNFKNRTYLVYAEDRGNKSKVEFHFPICDYLWTHVIEPRWSMRQNKCPWIIESPRVPGTPLHSIRGSHAKVKKLLNVVLSDHDIRRTFGSIAYAATKDILTVRRLMTHSQKAKNRETEVTERYVRTSEVTFRETVNKTVEQFMLYTNSENKFSGQLPSIGVDLDELDAEAGESPSEEPLAA